MLTAAYTTHIYRSLLIRKIPIAPSDHDAEFRVLLKLKETRNGFMDLRCFPMGEL